MDEKIITSSLELENADQVQKKFDELQLFLEKSRPLFAVLRKIYKFIDFYMESLSELANSPCKRGCNYCCEKPVDITKIEVLAIRQKYEVECFNMPTEGYSIHPLKPPMPRRSLCPFNKEGECTIYEMRPFVCRTFVTAEATAEPCDTAQYYNFFSVESNAVLKHLLFFITDHHQFKGGGDIRYFFGYQEIDFSNRPNSIYQEWDG